MKKLFFFALVGLFPLFIFGQATATTDAATSVDYSSATLNATLDVDGGAFYGVEFEYSTSATFTTSTKMSPSGGANYSANQSVVLPLTSLSSGTTYYFRVLVGFSTTNGGGITGSTLNFTTTSPAVPTVTIGSNFSGISATDASNTGNNATAENGASIDDKGLVFGTSSSPVYADGHQSVSSGLGTFAGSFGAQLSQLTKYYVRAYAHNSVGYGYSSTEKSFTTIASTDASISSMVSTQSGQLTITYSAGSGDGCIIYMRENDQNFTDPSNGTSYTGNSIYGSGDNIGGGGNYVVFSGASSKGSVLVTNLDDTKDYYFKIATYVGLGAGRNYDVNTEILNSADDSNLPVEFLSFTAQGNQQGTKLYWSTAAEINNHYFQVEKSEDAVFFKEIGRVDGAGNSNMRLDYSFIDSENLNKKVYYRLRQVDFDGTESFSQMIAVDQSNASAAIHYVFADDAALNVIVNTLSTQSTLRVLNMAGQVVREISLNGSMNHQLRISKTSLPKGLYLISLEDGHNRTVKKVVL